MTLVRERSFYRSFFRMCCILVLQNVITLSVNLADNLMLGAYSETALAGAAAVNQIQFVYQQLLISFGEGLVIIGTQYFGKRQTAPIRRIASIAMRFGLSTAVLLFVLVSCFPTQAVSLFTEDAAIVDAGVSYLRLIRFTYPFFALTQMLLATLRSVGTVRIALGLSVSTLLINGGINYVLIYGHFGAPELGIAGAAIGTLTARVVELVVLLLYLCLREKKLGLRLRDFLHTDRVLLRDYVRVTLPIFCAGALWGFNGAAQNAILGHLSSTAIAANSVASTLFLVVKSAAIGASSSASFHIGRAVGEGDLQKVRSYAQTLQLLFVGIGLAAGVVLFFLRIPILSVYNLRDETKALANEFLLILSAITVTMSYQMPTNAGIIRAGGDSKYLMILDIVSIWLVCIPLALVLAFVVKASPVAVVWALNADQIFKCVPAFCKANFGHWVKKLTREC